MTISDELCGTATWLVWEAKARLSKLMRRARAGEPQLIGVRNLGLVVSAESRSEDKRHLGRWLVETAPRGAEIELPPRGSDRGDPVTD